MPKIKITYIYEPTYVEFVCPDCNQSIVECYKDMCKGVIDLDRMYRSFFYCPKCFHRLEIDEIEHIMKERPL